MGSSAQTSGANQSLSLGFYTLVERRPLPFCCKDIKCKLEVPCRCGSGLGGTADSSEKNLLGEKQRSGERESPD